MDPITTAVLAALPLLATDVVKSVYEGLKAIIRHKWGESGSISNGYIAIPREGEIDFLAKARAAFTPAQPPSPKEKKAKKAPTPIKAATKKTATKKRVAA